MTSSWAGGIGLQVQQRRDDLQAVADAVVDFAQQHLALGGERRVAVARGVHLGLGFVAGPLHLGLPIAPWTATWSRGMKSPRSP